mmetsp:Transcript_9765/g.8603  ORF Transcript_9765/g.8603 Transcript_9765/m.8603 type:complete len:113 (+) Transcript_9765:834-1172(+)
MKMLSKKHKRNKTNKIGLNNDLKTDLDATGKHRSKSIQDKARYRKSKVKKLAKEPSNINTLIRNSDLLSSKLDYGSDTSKPKGIRVKQKSSLSVMLGSKRTGSLFTLPSIKR